MTAPLRPAQLVRLLGQWHAADARPVGARQTRNARRATPDYAALAATIRGLLIDGRLPLGVRVPAERELAAALGISRTTVAAAYRALRDSGHLASRRGAGSWTTMPGDAKVDHTGLWAPGSEPEMLDLATAALPAPAELAQAAREAVDEMSRYLDHPGYYPSGLADLRAAVADLYAARGLPTSADQIMITNGVLHAFDLACRLLVGTGQPVLVESPTYPNALTTLAARRARVLTLGLGAEGWDADLLLESLRQNRPRVAYLAPEFQNPTGHLMPVGLRERLPAVAHASGTELVVDESFVDLSLTGAGEAGGGAVGGGAAATPAGPAAGEAAWGGAAVAPPVACFDRHARVLSIGGMSKPYWGGLRVGWVRTSPPAVQRLTAVRVGTDMAGPVLDQLVAARLLRRAEVVVPARRRMIRERRDALVGALRERLPEWRFRVPDGGLSLWAELDAPVSSALARAAERYRLRLAPGPRFGVDGTLERFLRLPFTLPVPELLDAVDRLAAARADLDRPARRNWETPALVA